MQTRDPSNHSSLSDSWLSAEDDDAAGGLASSAPEVDPLIGTTLIDTYRVERLMAEGGMGRIYEAHHQRITEKRFAIKVLRPEFVNSSQIRARFEREMQAVARVTHPGVLSIVDVGTTVQGWSFMVSEHLGGLDLLAYLRRFGALDNDRTVQMGCRIAEALEATHAQGVIHRDVKPSNVFLLGAFEPLGPEWDGVKLIDFGLSRFVNKTDELTKSGVVMGTPAYMAPEQARGARTDHLTDVYGVGAVLYAAATGVPPFREDTQQQTLIAAMTRDPVRPRELNSSISEELEVLIQRAMSKRPEERHPSMSALRLALSDLELRTSSVHFASQRRTREVVAREGNARGVRLRFVALGATALVLGIAAVASAVVGITTLSLGGFVSTTSESLLTALALGSTLGLLAWWLRRLGRPIWSNTAKLLDRLPRLRAPVLTGLVVYGLGSIVLRVAREVLPHFAPGTALDQWPDVAWPGWSVLLSMASLFSAIGVGFHQSYWQPMSAKQRWVWGPLVASGALLLAFALAPPGFPGKRWASPSAGSASTSSPSGASVSLEGVSATTSAPAAFSAALDAGHHGGDAAAPLDSADAGGPANGAPAADLADAGSQPVIGSGVPPVVVPAALAAPLPIATPSVARVMEAPGLSFKGSNDAKSLEARAITHSQRASEMADAVRTLERLLTQSPEKANDPVVRSILTRAALMDGEPSREAFRVMSSSMGSKGPDLLYDLMLDQPVLAERAKFQLRRFRVRRRFSSALAIAYDLRFSTNCGSRYSLLDRANEVGDQRSIDTLSALLGKPEKCGRSIGLPCLPRCERESVAFTRSIERMSKRLRASQREASVK